MFDIGNVLGRWSGSGGGCGDSHCHVRVRPVAVKGIRLRTAP
ncbi:hypothetical protein FRUB_03157 [Fimbriiglobus ruber]|uniref:Uncharacterized protein n=1 Tax=Fimbriiglobus ruber TaxID=1908690 RepID=A0A225DYE3_9BACT|nr:hypothetical protein FRUB_03157 [Fimbriiglobus ruber]